MNQTISPEKINLLTDILKQSAQVSPENMVQFLINSAAKANSQGIYFTDSETELIINTLKTRMRPEQIQKMEQILRLSKMLKNRSV